MMEKFSKSQLFIILILVTFLAGCSAENNSGSAAAVETYFQALVSKDVNQLVNSSCAAWEADARQELRTFDAVAVSLQDLSCQATSEEGDNAQVACTGKIVANYGNEVLELALSDRTFLAIKEDGEWRMCGYR